MPVFTSVSSISLAVQIKGNSGRKCLNNGSMVLMALWKVAAATSFCHSSLPGFLSVLRYNVRVNHLCYLCIYAMFLNVRLFLYAILLPLFLPSLQFQLTFEHKKYFWRHKVPTSFVKSLAIYQKETNFSLMGKLGSLNSAIVRCTFLNRILNILIYTIIYRYVHTCSYLFWYAYSSLICPWYSWNVV